MGVQNASKRGSFRPGYIDGFILVYLTLSIVAYYLSPAPDLSLRRLTALLAGASGYGLLSMWLNEGHGRLQKLASGLALFGGIVALLALLVIEWPSRYLVDLSQIVDRLPHYGGDFFLNNNTAAGLMLFLLPLAWAQFRQSKHRTRFLYLASAIGMIFLLILTQSRNAYLGLIFGIAAAFLWGRIRFRYVIVVLLLLVITPFAAVTLYESADVQGADFVSAIDMSSKSGSARDQSWLSRLEIWSAAVQTMRDYPAVGAGLYLFDPVSRANYVYQVVYPDFDIHHAHNLFLQTGASLGWAGWLVISGLWISVMYALWRVSETYPSSDRWLPRALAAGTAGYIVFNSFDVLALEQRAGLLVWIILALSTGVIDESGFNLDRIRWAWAAPLVLFVVLLVSPASSRNLARLDLDRARFTGSMPPISGDLEAKLEGDDRRTGLLQYMRGKRMQALQSWEHDPEAGLFLLNQGQQSYLSSQNIEESLDWYSLSLLIDGDSGENYLWRGIALMDLGDTDQAMVDFHAAIVHGLGEYYYGVPVQAMAWANLGRLLLDRGKLAEAIYAFEQASALAPDVDDFRIQLHDIQKLLELME